MLRIKKIKPLFTNILTTSERSNNEIQTSSGIIQYSSCPIKPYQKVLEVGSSVRDIKVGDWVMINVFNYAVKRYDPDSIKNDMGMNKTIDYQFNTATYYDEDNTPQECLILNDRDVIYTFVGEEVETPAIEPIEKKLILPQQKTIITN